jgi:hypothetical protein
MPSMHARCYTARCRRPCMSRRSTDVVLFACVICLLHKWMLEYSSPSLPSGSRASIQWIWDSYPVCMCTCTCNVPRNVVNHVTWWITNSYHPASKIDCSITTGSNTSKLKLNIPDISTLMLSKFCLCAPPLGKSYTSFYMIKPNFLH